MCKVNNASYVKVILPLRQPSELDESRSITVVIVFIPLIPLWVDAKREVDTQIIV